MIGLISVKEVPQLKVQTIEAENINRLDWKAGFSFLTYGVCVGVRVQDASILPYISAHLPPKWKRTQTNAVDRLYSISSNQGTNILYSDYDELARAPSLEQLFETFESNLQLYVAEMSPHKVFIHAGVVGWGERAILIPGRSMSGKTTLVRELVRAGATYYSDEYAVLDTHARVHPYAKPLAIREEAGSLRQTKYAVETFGGCAGRKPLRVGLVVMSKYKNSAKPQRWKPRQLTAGQGVLDLLANTISVRRQPETTLATLRQIVNYAAIIKGVRGEASEVVEAILASLNNRR